MYLPIKILRKIMDAFLFQTHLDILNLDKLPIETKLHNELIITKYNHQQRNQRFKYLNFKNLSMNY